MTQATARFAHDCDCCTLVGATESHDLYLCPTSLTLVARFGNDGPEYLALDAEMVPHTRADSPLRLAFEKATAAGLLR